VIGVQETLPKSQITNQIGKNREIRVKDPDPICKSIRNEGFRTPNPKSQSIQNHIEAWDNIIHDPDHRSST
jgi:hypothetical protein